MTTDEAAPVVRGHVKWFDPGKGFGFVVADEGGPDILLHANVLRNFGQSSVADGSAIAVTVQRTERGMQAVSVLSIVPRPVPRARRSPIWPRSTPRRWRSSRFTPRG